MNKFPIVVSDTAQHIALNIGNSAHRYIVSQISKLQSDNPVIINELCAYAANLGEVGRGQFGFDDLSHMYLVNSIVGGGIIVYNMLLAQHEADELAAEPDLLLTPAYRAALEAGTKYERGNADKTRFDNAITIWYNNGSKLEFKCAYGIRFGRWVIIICDNSRIWCVLTDEIKSYASTSEVLRYEEKN